MKRTNFIKKIKGQATLEMTIVIIIIVLFLGGIINIWAWANTQIVKRQLRYNASRVVAGTSTDVYVLQWPVYAPDNLTEDMVLLDPPRFNRAEERE